MVKYMKNNKCTVLNMDTNFLKIIAIVTMVIDHVGVVFFPSNLLMRSIGRIAFPIFTYCLMIGYFNTHDLKKYILRLLMIGIISQPIYVFLFNTYTPNIMFTLIAELLLYYSLDKKKWLYIPFLIFIPILLKFDYSVIYFFLVPIFYYCRNNKLLLFVVYMLYYFNYAVDSQMFGNIPSCITVCSIFSLPFILFNTNIKLKFNKYIFYIFYPLHLLILLMLKYIIM